MPGQRVWLALNFFVQYKVKTVLLLKSVTLSTTIYVTSGMDSDVTKNALCCKLDMYNEGALCKCPVA